MVDLVYLSIPTSAAPGQGDEPETRLQTWIKNKIGARNGIASIALPDLKIGTLDNLVIQGEEAARIDGQLQGVVGKIHDVISQLNDGDAKLTAKSELIDGMPAAHYLTQFGWNTAKYRPDKQISQLIEMLTNDAFNADADLKARFTSYQNAKTQLSAAERKKTGDLTVRSLDSIVKKDHIIHDSEYIESVLVVVPTPQIKEFETKYETLSDMVVPRSAQEIKKEKDFTLFSVAVFKKFASDFAAKVREAKWVPRDLEYSDDMAAQEEQQYSTASSQVAKLHGEVSRLASAAFSDVIKAWGHVKVIRLFVESVLRYGLPPTFVTAAFEPEKSVDKAIAILVDKFGFLGGAAVKTDSKGRIQDDSDLHEYGAVVEHDYKPFVIYELQLP